jgi:hypothetical protein
LQFMRPGRKLKRNMLVSCLILLCSFLWLAPPGPAGAATEEITQAAPDETKAKPATTNDADAGAAGSQEVGDTGIEVLVDPVAGATVSLNGKAAVNIPAGALNGTVELPIAIHKVTDPPSPPQGYKLLDSVFEFTVGGETSYNFAKPVTLTLSYLWDSLPTGQTPAVHYYDEADSKWVSLGGTIYPDTVEVTVDHFTKYGLFALKGLVDRPAPDTVPDAPSPQDALTDIAGHWAENNIKEMVTLGVISGYPDSSFRPDAPITRAEFATFLVKAMIKSMGYTLEAERGFDDTSEHWAALYIASAFSYGVVSGYDDKTFGPDDTINREQMAAMLVRAVEPAPAAEGPQFADSRSISDWAGDGVAAAVKSGIMTGYPDNTFAPQGKATRAEAVTAILNALKTV